MGKAGVNLSGALLLHSNLKTQKYNIWGEKVGSENALA